MKKQKGMTLVELMVTLLIASILVGYAVPNMRDFLLQQSVRNKANDMLTDFAFARNEAINKSTSVRIYPKDSEWAKGWEVATDINGNGSIDGADEVVRVGNPEDLALTFTGSTDDIVFKGTGSLNSTTSRSIVIEHSKIVSKKTLTVALSGSTSVR